MSMNAAAIVVGIGEYDLDQIPRLDGAVQDARTAVAWLRRVGVPDERIHVHVSPLPAVGGAISGIAAKTATYQSIVESMETLSKQTGDRLFLFLSGHGLNVPGGGPVFLTQDYGPGVARVRNNLGIDAFTTWFLSWGFRDQFLFYDACQNASSPEEVKSTIKPTSVPMFDALPLAVDTSLLACYSASPSQRAWAGNGQGPLVQNVLRQLDPIDLRALGPDDPRQEAVIYDWSTGESRLDMRFVFERIVARRITAEAAFAGLVQTPMCLPFGRSASLGVAPIFELPTIPVSDIDVTIDPPEAVEEVLRASLAATLPPRRLILPEPGHRLPNPITAKVPTRVEFEASCSVRPESDWVAINSPQRKKVGSGRNSLTLRLRKGVPPSPEKSAFNIAIYDDEGTAHAPLGDYDDIASAAGIDPSLPFGVTLEAHEYGPDIYFSPWRIGSEDAARAVAFDWLSAIRANLAGTGLSTMLIEPGAERAFRLPNLTIELPAGASGLAGHLSGQLVVGVFASGESEPMLRLSPDDVERDGREHLPPGEYRVEVDLPWGYWSQTVTIRDDEVAACTLPARVGVQPLRNGGARDNGTAGAPVGTLVAAESLGIAIAHLDGDPPRVEPLSRTTLPEWDLLFTALRPEAIRADRIELIARGVDRANEPIERELLSLGLAYSAHLQDDPFAMSAALDSVSYLRWTFDFAILDARRGQLAGEDAARQQIEDLIRVVRVTHDPRVAPMVLTYSRDLLERLTRESGEAVESWAVKGSVISALMVMDNPSPPRGDELARALNVGDPLFQEALQEERREYAGHED